VRHKRLLNNLKFAAQVGGRVGNMVVQIRGKPRSMDWAALAVEAISASCDAWDRYNEERMYDMETVGVGPWLNDQGWAPFHPALRPHIESAVSDIRAVSDLPEGLEESVVEASIGEEKVRWYGERDKEGRPNKKITPKTIFFYRSSRYIPTMDALSQSFWRRAANREIHYDGWRLAQLPVVEGIRETGFIRDLEARCRAFIGIEGCRGMLIDGLPGTGKSQAIREVLNRLELRTLHVDRQSIVDMLTQRIEHGEGAVSNVDMMIRIIRPDAVVIDDIDRIVDEVQPGLFSLIEQIKGSGHVKLLLTTSNHQDALLGPILRPGRIDDLVPVPDLEEEVVREILGYDADLASQMTGWPVAYVRDYVARREALGAEAARAELPSLARRVEEAKKASKPEPAWESVHETPYVGSLQSSREGRSRSPR
jgi:hypothetical protein